MPPGGVTDQVLAKIDNTDYNTMWTSSAGGGGSAIYVADTAPAGAPDKSLWVESDTGLLFFRWNDGTSLQWVSLGTPTGNAVMYTPQTLTAPQQVQARQNISALSTVKIVTFTASGTYTPTVGIIYCVIECVGAGGGGAGAQSTSGNVAGGGGGGSGSYSRKLATAAQIGASQTVTIGTGGTLGISANGSGGAGGDTSVGSLCIGKGGGGGGGGSTSLVNGGAGGVYGTGDVLTAGNQGGFGAGYAITTIHGFGGAGAPSVFGGGVFTPVSVSSGGVSGKALGAGGSGGYSYNAISAAPGGNGAPGSVIITEYII